MMKITLVACLVVALMRQEAKAVITVALTDFSVDCGTANGPISIQYTNPNPAINNVVKMYSPDVAGTCEDNDADNNDVYVINNVNTDCVDFDAGTPELNVQISLQEFPGLRLTTDPKFVFTCIYSAAIPVLSITDDGGNVIGGTPTTQDIATTVNADQTYTLELINSAGAATTVAQFGEDVTLRVTMGGVDTDEQGVQIKSMNVTSGAISLVIIDNYCVVAPYEPLFQQTGFITAAPEATFPLTLFALEGSNVDTIQFDLEAIICPANCDGNNCPAAGKRKKRAAGDETDVEDTLKMSTKLYVLPVDAKLPSYSHATEDGSNTVTCMQSLGFIVTVAVLAVLLLVAMVTVVFMFTTRRREQQKQGA